MNHPGRVIIPEDRARLLAALARHKPHDFEALRTAALVRLAWCSALRESECLALETAQLVDEHGHTFRIRSSGYLRPKQSKRSRNGRWHSGAQFVVTPTAAKALRLYIEEARSRGWLLVKPAARVFIAQRRNGGTKEAHGPFTRKGAFKAWRRLQRRAGIEIPYRFHDLRHDAITRFAQACHGDAFKVARFARCDLRTALRYAHAPFSAIADIAAVAARS